MKYLIVALIAAFSFNAAAQESGLVWETDMMKAVDQSIKENKPLFLFFTGSDWCGWCRRLQSEVFTQPQFATWAKKNVVLVELDFPRNKPLDPKLQQQNYEIANMFGITGYPTVWIVTATKKDSQVAFGKMGSTGYVAGGPDVWIQGADRILHSQE